MDEENVITKGRSSSFDLYAVWASATCNHDPDALGCYVTSDASFSVVVNLRNICKASLQLVTEPEDALVGTVMHFFDLCLIHELTHWGSGDDSHHTLWSDFIMLGLIIPLCPATATG